MSDTEDKVWIRPLFSYELRADGSEKKTVWSYGVPRKLKCVGCQLGDHCNGEDDNCYCECTENAPSV